MRIRRTCKKCGLTHFVDKRTDPCPGCEEQRRSFAFGNVSMGNPNVTRDMVNQVADEMATKETA